MRLRPTALPEVMVIEPRVHRDARGFFVESYHESRYREHGICDRFVQDNHSRSLRGTLRGLHAQLERPQAKLVRVTSGEIFDVAVDIRRASASFGRWVGVRLSAESFRQCYIPAGFAHGFCVVSASAEVEYKCSAYYDPGDEISIAWNDREIGIAWPIRDPTLSDRDARALPLARAIPG